MATLWLLKLPLIFVRPFNYIGHRQSIVFIVAKIAVHIRRLAPVLELGNLDVERDFSTVRMVVDAYMRLLSVSYPPARPIKICLGKGTKLLKMIYDLSEIDEYPPNWLSIQI